MDRFLGMRDTMKNWWLLAGLAAVLMAGCSGGGEAKVETTTTEEGLELTTGKDLEVMVFAGGYGSDFYEQAAKEYEAETGVKVTVIGDARIDQQIKPRFMEGNPPGLAFPGWRFDHWAAASEGEVMPLDDVLKGKAWKSEESWGSTFEEGLLKIGRLDGKQYVLPYYLIVMGWWYDPAVFAANGWEPPRNYSELLALCQKIKAKGMAPIAYPGQYPYYMIAGTLIPWTISSGGIEAYQAIQNLEPGAWNSPHVIKAAKMIADLRAQDYFMSGSSALSHTEAQTEFLNGKAAMVPCGTWIHAEMLSQLKPGQTLEYMMPPVIEGGAGDPTALMIKLEPWLVPTKSKNQEHAVGFFKYMTSKEKAQQFVKEKGTLMSMKGSNDVELPPYLQNAAEAFKNSKTVWAEQWRDWYPTLYRDIEENMTRLLNGDLTPEEFGAACEEAAERTRNNPDTVIRKAE